MENEKNQETLRFLFSPLQRLAIEGANKMNEATKKYIEVLSQQGMEMTQQIASLRQKVEGLEAKLRTLSVELSHSENNAKKQYEETLRTVVSEFETPPPPWKAVVVIDNGKPLGVDIVRGPAETSNDKS